MKELIDNTLALGAEVGIILIIVFLCGFVWAAGTDAYDLIRCWLTGLFLIKGDHRNERTCDYD